MPVDLYVGGSEHTVMHLLFARFWFKVMYDAGLTPFKEPFNSLRHQGMLLAGRRLAECSRCPHNWRSGRTTDRRRRRRIRKARLEFSFDL